MSCYVRHLGFNVQSSLSLLGRGDGLLPCCCVCLVTWYVLFPVDIFSPHSQLYLLEDLSIMKTIFYVRLLMSWWHNRFWFYCLIKCACACVCMCVSHLVLLLLAQFPSNVLLVWVPSAFPSSKREVPCIGVHNPLVPAFLYYVCVSALCSLTGLSQGSRTQLC